MARRVHTLSPRFRIYSEEEIALGPGKVDLLRAIADKGSIQGAARQLHMSYMRAWELVQTMNRCFKKPLVVAARGGARKGGARLTPTGVKMLALYLRLSETTLQTIRPIWKEISKLLR